MLWSRLAFPLLPMLMAAAPAAAQKFETPLNPAADHTKRYDACLKQARSDPLKALPMAEKWHADGGGLAARHCVAVAMFQAGRYVQAAAQFEAIARDMGQDRPRVRAELWAQAGQAYMEVGGAEKAAEAQGRALELNGHDADLWLERALSYAAMQAWPRAISDLDQALRLRPNDVEILVLRAAAWRNAGNPTRALDDANRALKIASDHSEALLERGFAHLARGERAQAIADFDSVLRLVPPDSKAARRAEAGKRGEPPGAQPSAPAPPPKPGGNR
ncbi:tetratricopeptide repeat protein [Reyranella sp.]|uniref:tetratricopeptide repeat protein n=1 Tax=Reyranella sp. TaxID=1929291 RepID=UPI0037845B67